ncbi:grpE protein homolog, mitochondrial-like isoform X1 [Solanum tuberosum]|uniref:GrpE protein homolog n=1 Tax=Solanum tuberosum TaxID=4113 RepID=M1AZ79_SOLTU|nr:PREDICTED: grpE protein homolog, mitochondrial-like isoform X1 [Solanum tuberosum]XP_015163089.1 PREDICTED: grpE protein homolog, mitochondrial-like isoform X1 [Solanum tuberosum]
MLVSRIPSRFPKSVVAQCRSSLLLYSREQQQQQYVPSLASQFHSFREFKEKVTLFHESVLQRFGISSSASPQHNEKETSQSQSKLGSTKENGEVNEKCEASVSADSQGQDENDESGPDLASNDNTNENVKRRRRRTKQAASSDSDSDLDTEDLSRDDLVKLVAEKEELLKIKDDEFQKMKEKALRSYAEMENVMNRTKREAENSKKFAIQNFVKSLLDVADNMERASSVVKESFSKIDESKDTVGAVPLLKTLLEGVEMTDKQLSEVFKKFGVGKYDPTNEEFDPNKHNAVFQVPDPKKAPGMVAVCLKSGYTLHDRIIRPAEVGVTVAMESTKAD